MTNRTKNYLRWLPTFTIALFMISGATMKFLGASAMTEIYSKNGMLEFMKPLAMIEMILIAVFLWPRTMKIGFYLLTGYYGGAMAVEMSKGIVFIAPAMILVIIWIAAFMRDSSIFKMKTNRKVAFS